MTLRGLRDTGEQKELDAESGTEEELMAMWPLVCPQLLCVLVPVCKASLTSAPTTSRGLLGPNKSRKYLINHTYGILKMYNRENKIMLVIVVVGDMMWDSLQRGKERKAGEEKVEGWDELCGGKGEEPRAWILT